ncbi:MAG: recombinase RecX, partial [Formosa sp.]|nr:recombinase RecX [Formosa sp.]MDG1374718.1 recombinase RecX [Flavobacteriaceae bacterium]
MYQTHKSYTIEEALSKLQKYCAYQDRCHKEVEQKLKQMRMIPEAIEII